MARFDLTDAEWAAIEPVLPTDVRGKDRADDRRVYVAGLLAVTHYIWLVKSDVRQPLLWAAAVCVLLLARWPADSPLAAATRAWVRRQLTRVP